MTAIGPVPDCLLLVGTMTGADVPFPRSGISPYLASEAVQVAELRMAFRFGLSALSVITASVNVCDWR